MVLDQFSGVSIYLQPAGKPTGWPPQECSVETNFLEFQKFCRFRVLMSARNIWRKLRLYLQMEHYTLPFQHRYNAFSYFFQVISDGNQLSVLLMQIVKANVSRKTITCIFPWLIPSLCTKLWDRSNLIQVWVSDLIFPNIFFDGVL